MVSLTKRLVGQVHELVDVGKNAMRTMNRLTRCSLAALLTLFFVSGVAYAQPVGDEGTPALAEGDAPAEGDAVPGEGEPGDVPEADGVPAPEAGPAPVATDVPVNLRLRRLEQRVQALKERAWRAKARVGMLKEAVLGGGVGARAGIRHVNKMGNSYRLVKLVYALDGAQIFARNDPSGALHNNKSFDVLTGPISPGSHTISVLALYRGHGYGVFKYLKKYKFTVRSSHTFTATEGKGTDIEVVAFERGGVTTPLEKRPAFDFKVNVRDGSKGK
ncbi:MAG: hypothetical protein GY811_13830 [Myxococcales bacterium]|nr:hypothetical protein [Myxococcales bacterium]